MFAVVTGLITGIIAWRIFEFLDVPEPLGLSWAGLVVLVPVLWILGVMLGYFLSRWVAVFAQFSKFVAIGFTNAAVDFGALNLLIVLTGATDGLGYTFVKAAAFVAAVIPSYYWNKYWSFGAGGSAQASEFIKFISVSVIAIVINSASASLVVNYVDPILQMTPEQWANVGAIVGSAVALIFNFVGYKLAVFKR